MVWLRPPSAHPWQNLHSVTMRLALNQPREWLSLIGEEGWSLGRGKHNPHAEQGPSQG